MYQNKFIKKFQNKTDAELEFIIENRENYTEKAVAASVYILNERSKNTLETKLITNKFETEEEKNYKAFKKNSAGQREKWYKNYYAIKLFWFGITSIVCAFYFFAPTLFTSQDSLTEKYGKVVFVKTFYSEVKSQGHKSVKSQLILKLENDRRIYRLIKNIGKTRYNEKYELIEKKIKKVGKVIISIKKSEEEYKEPRVFQLAINKNNILYDMDDVKSELRFIFPFMLIIGCFGVGIYINHKYPILFKNFFK